MTILKLLNTCCLCLCCMIFYGCQSQNTKTIHLQVQEQKIAIQGKESSFYAIVPSDSTFGLVLDKGSLFDVVVENHLSVPTSIHWHGLILPNHQDGVAFITQFPIYPGQSYPYHFPLIQSGTYFMHAHYGLQMQKLYTAPLILQDPQEKGIADQDVVLLLNDFTFTPPSKILSNLQCKNRDSMADKGPDLTDVNYDAFLVNFHAIENPDTIEVRPQEKIRLRCINGASGSNFIIDLGILDGEVIAVDGNRIQPVKGKVFDLGVAQRLDVVITIPQQGGSFPILAKGLGTTLQGGAILYTKGASLPPLTATTSLQNHPVSYDQELQFHALNPLLPREVDQKFELILSGSMQDYIWMINDQAWPEIIPLVFEKGKRVEITFINKSGMSHPMHLHGHVFQVTEINGVPYSGALRDTILVLPHSSVTIQLDANNPGTWPLHCHLLYHGATGMFTLVRYAGD